MIIKNEFLLKAMLIVGLIAAVYFEEITYGEALLVLIYLEVLIKKTTS